MKSIDALPISQPENLPEVAQHEHVQNDVDGHQSDSPEATKGLVHATTISLEVLSEAANASHYIEAEKRMSKTANLAGGSRFLGR